jgi:hypothetical protein
VCFFAHSEAELRVTQYSKLDTAAVVAAQQLSQLAADGTLPSDFTSVCGSISAGSNTASSVHSGSSDGGDVKAAFVNLSSPCGSESSMPVRAAACDGLASGFTAGMMLTQQQQQTAMLEMQFQGNTNAALLAADAVSIAASTAPAMWLGGSSTGMLQQQMAAPGMTCGNVLPQQQVVYLDAASNTMGFTQGVSALPAAAAAGTNMMNGWMLAPNAAAAAPVAINSLQDQWVANNMLAAAQQRNAAAYGGLAGAAAGFSCAPAAAQVQGALPMPNMLGGGNVLDQWLQLENAGAYGGPPGLNRPAMGGSISVAPMQQQQPGAANARMAHLLSSLPDQTVQQLLASMQ